MKILGIETSTYSGSISVVEDSSVLGECLINIGPKHSETIVSSIDWLLKEIQIDKKGLDAVAVSKGPGSFTSLRIGISVAKGIAYCLGIKVLGVSSLEILASNVYTRDSVVCPVIDAKREEVYSALYRYENQSLKKLVEESIFSVDELCMKIEQPSIFLGDGALLYKDKFSKKLGNLSVFAPNSLNLPRASNCALIGVSKIEDGFEDDVFEIVPEYIRKSNAEISINKK